MTSQCQHCGAQVTEQYARVFGDEDNVVHRCLACDCKNRLQKGSAAGKELTQPDPAEHPNRNRGHLADDSIDYGKGPVPDGGHKVVPVTQAMQDALVTGRAKVVLTEDTDFFNPFADWLLIRGPDGIFAKGRYAGQVLECTAESVRQRFLDRRIDHIADFKSLALEDPLPELDSFETLQEYVPVESKYEEFSCYVLQGIGPAPEDAASESVATDGGNRGGAADE